MADCDHVGTEISVQELIKHPLSKIPQKYIIDHESPISPLEVLEASVPLIDLNNFLHEETKLSELQNFHSACKEWGIFQLANHGLEASLLEKLKLELEGFYALPLEERMKFKIREGEFEGYGQHLFQSSGDRKVDWADRFYMITNPIWRRKAHLLPKLPLSLRTTLEMLISEVQKIAKALLQWIAEALKIDIKDMFEDGMQSVRMNYYPPGADPGFLVRGAKFIGV